MAQRASEVAQPRAIFDAADATSAPSAHPHSNNQTINFFHLVSGTGEQAARAIGAYAQHGCLLLLQMGEYRLE
jgi:hypothetical protein